MPERKALQKAENDKEVDVQCVADGEDLLKQLKTQVADPTMPTFFPADPVGEVTRLQQMVVELQRQLHMGFPWSHHRVFLWSHHQFLQSGFGRGRTTFQRRNTRSWSGWQAVKTR